MIRLTTLGPYRLERPLDPGTLGPRFRTRHAGRRAVVESVSIRADDEVFERFLRHIGLLAAIGHPHVVELLDSGLDAHHLYLVTPAPERTVEETGVLPGVDAAAVISQVAAALHELHRQGIVHRNLQARHVGWYRGIVKLGGIGVADVRGSSETCGVGPIGAVATMAPSVAIGRRATPGSDVFSLGALLHVLTTGISLHPERPGDSLGRQLHRVGATPAQISADFPPALRQVLVQAISADGCDTSAPLDQFRCGLAEYLAADSAGSDAARKSDAQARVDGYVDTSHDDPLDHPERRIR